MLDRLDAHSPRRAWLSAALLCIALLVLPLLTWLVVPSPGEFAPPPSPPRVHVAVAASMPERPTPTRVEPAARVAEAVVATSEVQVTGVVLDPDGKPVSGAFVGCNDRDKELATSTDAEGRFTLGAPASGCLVVSHHPDFTPSEPMAVTPGRTNTIHLRAAGAIDGVVVDEKGNAIAPYLLAIESFMGTGEAAETIPPTGHARTITDAKGAFLWEKLMPGKYVLTASADGRPPARSGQIEVEAARTTHHVRIVLARGAVLSGTVIDAETRKPVAGAVIAFDALTSTGANSIGNAHTDESGAYTLDGAPPGPFSIRVASEKYRTRTISGLTTRNSAPLVQDVELTLRDDGGASDEMGGIGVVLAPQPTGVMVAWVMPGGPAQAADLRVGDVITRIDGLDARAWTMIDCMQRLRGPAESHVLVAVSRPHQAAVEVVVTRKNINR